MPDGIQLLEDQAPFRRCKRSYKRLGKSVARDRGVERTSSVPSKTHMTVREGSRMRAGNAPYINFCRYWKSVAVGIDAYSFVHVLLSVASE
jgi:hypothetical protein